MLKTSKVVAMCQDNEYEFQVPVRQDEGYDFQTFLYRAGFEEEEMLLVMDELNAYRSIPGTTLRRYMNRVLDSVEDGHRTDFLKGVVIGTAIHDNLENYDLERHINAEVARRLNEILADLEMDSHQTGKPEP